MNQKKSGFTLIELLIVVAIIAILAAIAVPNFLEAQTRAKVSRVKSDLRTLATGIESYAVDWNNPPPEARNGESGIFAPRTIEGITGQSGILSVALSTPVAYLVSSDLKDVFYSGAGASSSVTPDVILFSYKPYPWEWSKRTIGARPDTAPLLFGEGNALNGARFKELYGTWRIFSVGPDRDWDNIPTNARGAYGPGNVSAGLPYDPTNGTVSVGSILRSQAQSEQKTWQQVSTLAGLQ
ncbi:prepilin-type N-terminal cleavage/methylation domain-containing protein [Candidatus Sumerlaeota bacterium]|nr:prepilin-type N-terminal cleavage/methylation domain-containing protein [Candidatus Sumerlaeota bacterium]